MMRCAKMKKDFTFKPEKLVERWPNEFTVSESSWHGIVTAISEPLFVVTGWKANGKENACLQSRASFFGSYGEYICILGWVRKKGHMYKSLKETGCCVLNFPSKDIAGQCFKTIKNNSFDVDEITESGLTAEKAAVVNAPRIKECFLNIECEYLWEHELSADNQSIVTVALKAVGISMDSEHYDESKLGCFGEKGYLFLASDLSNPDTGEMRNGGFAFVDLHRRQDEEEC